MIFQKHYQCILGQLVPLQEISISNGWDEVYLKLAEQFEKIRVLS